MRSLGLTVIGIGLVVASLFASAWPVLLLGTAFLLLAAVRISIGDRDES